MRRETLRLLTDLFERMAALVEIRQAEHDLRVQLMGKKGTALGSGYLPALEPVLNPLAAKLLGSPATYKVRLAAAAWHVGCRSDFAPGGSR